MNYNNILLISEQTLKADSLINDNVDNQYILPAITLAQDTGLQPLIGTKLFQKLQKLVNDDEIGLAVNSIYKTLLDDFNIDSEDVITLTKPYNRVYQFKLISENANSVKIDETQELSDSDKKEIFWLTKVIGNYNITKVGENYIFKNGSRSILLQRV